MAGLFKFGLVIAILYAGYCYLSSSPPAGRAERMKAIEAEWKAARKVEAARKAVKAADAKAAADAAKAEAEKRAAVRIPARTIIANYQSNELYGDQLYQGKELAVTGTIDTIGKDLLGNPYLTVDRVGITSLQCIFDKTDTEILALMSRGSPVTMRGVVGRKMINVVMTGCRLLFE